MYPYEVNEDPLDTDSITEPGKFYSYETNFQNLALANTKIIYKYSRSYMNMNFLQSDIWVLKASSQNANLFQHSISLNTGCL